MNINIKTVKSIFLHRALVLVNAYKCAKFQLPSFISYRDMEGSKNGASDLLRRTLAGKLLHVARIPANGYQRTKFQLSRSISNGNMRGSQKKKWELLISPDAPSGQIFIQSTSTRKCLQVCQISTF